MKSNFYLPSFHALFCSKMPATRDKEDTQKEEDQRTAPASSLPSISKLRDQRSCCDWLKKSFGRKHAPEECAPQLEHATPQLEPAQWEPGFLLISSERGDALLRNLRLDETNNDNASGGFGSVSTFKNENNKKLIGKILIKERQDEQGNIQDDLAREFMAYQTIYDAVGPHPNLGNVYGIAQVPHGKEMKRALLMDAIPGLTGVEAFDALRECWYVGKISSEEYWGAIQFIGRRLLDVAKHLESSLVVHNDIKPENFMVNENTGEPVLIDLGLWTKTGEKQTGGTRLYQPPETQSGTKYVDGRSDLFSIGASLVRGIEGKTERQPNEGLLLRTDSFKDDKGNIMRQPGTYSAETNYTDFIDGVLENNRSDRPFIFEAQEHEFINHMMLDDDAAKKVIIDAISLAKKEKAKPEEERWKQPEPECNDNALGERCDQVQKEIEELEATPNLHVYAKLQNIGNTHPKLKIYLDGNLSDVKQELAKTVEADADKYIEQAEWFARAESVLKEVPNIPVKSGVNINGIRRKTEDKGIDPKYADDVNRARIALAPYVDIETLKRYVDDTKQFLYEAGTLKRIDKQEANEKIGQVRVRSMLARRMLEIFEPGSSSTKEVERAYVQEYDQLDLFFALRDGTDDAVQAFAKSVLQSQLSDEQKVELLAARNADAIPGLFVALKWGKADAVWAFAESILQSQLSDEQKVELLAARRPDGASGLFFALFNDKADAVRAFAESVLQSQLGDEQKVKLLTAKNADGVPGLSSALQWDGATNAVQAFVESILQSQLSDEQKVELLAAKNADGVPGLSSALQWDNTNAVQAFVESVLQSQLCDEQKVELLAAKDADGTSGLSVALWRGTTYTVRAFMKSVSQSQLSDEQKAEVLGAKNKTVL